MHKGELLRLHEQVVIIEDHFSARGRVDSSLFDPYDELAVEPSHIRKSKSEHRHAVFVLGNAFAAVMSDDRFSSAGRIGKRMEESADDAEGKI